MFTFDSRKGVRCLQEPKPEAGGWWVGGTQAHLPTCWVLSRAPECGQAGPILNWLPSTHPPAPAVSQQGRRVSPAQGQFSTGHQPMWGIPTSHLGLPCPRKSLPSPAREGISPLPPSAWFGPGLTLQPKEQGKTVPPARSPTSTGHHVASHPCGGIPAFQWGIPQPQTGSHEPCHQWRGGIPPSRSSARSETGFALPPQVQKQEKSLQPGASLDPCASVGVPSPWARFPKPWHWYREGIPPSYSSAWSDARLALYWRDCSPLHAHSCGGRAKPSPIWAEGWTLPLVGEPLLRCRVHPMQADVGHPLSPRLEGLFPSTLAFVGGATKLSPYHSEGLEGDILFVYHGDPGWPWAGGSVPPCT